MIEYSQMRQRMREIATVINIDTNELRNETQVLSDAREAQMLSTSFEQIRLSIFFYLPLCPLPYPLSSLLSPLSPFSFLSLC